MTPNPIDERHFSAMTKAVFTSAPDGGPPAWLQAQFEKCVSHYQNVQITPQFRTALHQFQNQQQEPFEIFVVGEGNFGKSTLVNALVGQKISAVDFRPETRSFLRYVLRSNPETDAIIYAKLQSGIHDWIKDRFGDGEPCDEIYAARRYRLPRDEADEWLAMDSAACREHGAKYTPAILEIERQLPWTPESLFPERVRLVDTQGLNQIFDDDLLKRYSDMETYNSETAFDNWMATSRRGKHLDWQFRRCNAVLWLISAVKPSSGASRSALRYLSKYGKRTVFAITQIDRVQGDASQLERVLAEIRKKFSEFGSDMNPINGKLAMESSVPESPDSPKNPDGIQSSGLASLVGRLRTVCLEDAGMVRAISQYISLKTTEAQLRTAIGTMVDEIKDIQKRLSDLRGLLEETRKNVESEVGSSLSSAGYKQLYDLKSRAEGVGLMDNTKSALVKIQLDVARQNFENSSRGACIVLRGRLEALANGLNAERFALPTFDAEGRADGAVVSVTCDAKMDEIALPSISLSFSLDMRPWDAATTWLLKKVPWTREKAEAKERTENEKRRGEIVAELRTQWDDFEAKTIRRIIEQTAKVFAALERGLARIESEIEAVDKRRMDETVSHLRSTHATPCARSPYLVTVVSAMRGAIARAKPARMASTG